ncbi:MAG: acireductone synthase [Turneriella sp.]|nr:acireductone synthase [Turneriella sp.]
MAIQAVLCDIEGTTSSIAFVHRVLFPLSLERMDSFLAEHASDPEVKSQLEVLWQKLHGTALPQDGIAELAAILKDYVRKDVKDTTLKWVQGKIWKKAFEDGSIRGHVYPDVPPAWRRWCEHGIRIFIYSSGSVEAQKLLFRYSEAGDLTPLLSGYFDTTTGPKKEKDSYTKIAHVLGMEPAEILFLSDSHEELIAASAAGLATCLLLRDGAALPSGYSAIFAQDFNEVEEKFLLCKKQF